MKHLFLLVIIPFFGLQISNAQPGQFDPSFGSEGIVKAPLGFVFSHTSASASRQVLLQPDGKMYVVLEAFTQNSIYTYIAKRLPNGSADSGYANNGFSDPVKMIQAYAALQPDGKIVLAGYNDNAIVRLNTQGKPDSSFDADGSKTITYNPTALAIQRDGKILVIGNSVNANYDFQFVRYNSDGSIDNNFQPGGTPFVSSKNLAIQADGRIVAVGLVSNSSAEYAVKRYNINGNPDDSFDGDGSQAIGFSSTDLALQSDGKIVVSGVFGGFESGDFAVARYTAEGQRDSTFSSDGIQRTDFGFNDIALSVAIASGGKIVVGGYSYKAAEGTFSFKIARYNQDGNLDGGFSDDGYRQISVGASTSLFVAVQGDGKIVVTGGELQQSFNIERYLTSGELDKNFGQDGILSGSLPYTQTFTFFTSTVAQNDGKLIAAGYTSNGIDYDFALARYKPDGTLDDSFGDHGKQITNIGPGNDYAYSVAIQNDGKIILAGAAGNVFAITRYNSDGSLDSTFGSNGKQTTDFGFVNASATSIAIQSDGKIIAAGTTSAEFEQVDYDEDGEHYSYYNASYFALARYNANGSPDSSFSGSGKLTTSFGVSRYGSEVYDVAHKLIIQQDGKILVVGTSENQARGGGLSYFALARYNNDGSMDNTFSQDGKELTYPVLDGSDFGNAVAARSAVIQTDGKIIVGGNVAANLVLVRYNNDGSIDNTFADQGIQNTRLGIATDLALQAGGKIISSTGGISPLRFNTDGSPDSTFKTDAKPIPEVGLLSDIKSILISKNKLYAVGSAPLNGSVGIIARYLLDDGNKTAPTISITTPLDSATFAAPANIRLTAIAADTDGTITKVEFYNGTTLLRKKTTSLTPGHGKMCRLANIPSRQKRMITTASLLLLHLFIFLW